MFPWLFTLLLPYAASSETAEFFVFKEHKWAEAAKHFLGSLNMNVQPCDNFFQHVCGNNNWTNQSAYESELMLKGNSFNQLGIKLIQDINISSASIPEYMKSLRNYFDECVKLHSAPDWKKKLFLSLNKRIGLFGSNSSLKNESGNDLAEAWRFVGMLERQIMRGIYFNSFFSDGPKIMITADKASPAFNTDTGVQKLCQNKSESDFQKIIDEMKEHSDGLLDSIGNDTSALITSLLDLCSALVIPPTGTEDTAVVVNEEVLSKQTPHFLWDELINGIVKENQAQFKSQVKLYLHIRDIEVLERHGQAFQKAGVYHVRLLGFITVWTQMTNDPTKLIKRDPLKPEQVCLNKANIQYAPAMSRLYLNHFGRDATEFRLELLQFARNIFAAFRFLLITVDWLDMEDKERIHKKADSIKVDPGQPEWINNDEEITKRVPDYKTSIDFFENDFGEKTRIFDYMIERILNGDFVSEPFNEPGSAYPSISVNANYEDTIYRLLNEGPRMHILTAIAFPPIFETDFPIAVKYGALGSIFGHELMHAFDANVIKYPLLDGRPIIKNTTLKEYEKLNQCLEVEYAKFCTGDRKHCVSGKATLGENIADIAGLKVAYIAYKVLSQLQGDDPQLPGLHNYTNDQLFFMSHARVWCARGFHELIWSNEHAPGEARIEVAYRHIPQFASAFGCSSGSKYDPDKKCDVWGNIANAAAHRFQERFST